MIRKVVSKFVPAMNVCVVLALVGCGKKPAKEMIMETKPKQVKIETTMGDIFIEVNEQAAPATTANFLRYVREGFYDGTIFHRIIPNFMIQGGGFGADMKEKAAHKPIVNEASNGLKNERGTIAMARTNDPNSATAQFFINVVNNNYLNYANSRNPGYAVFGKIVKGIDVIDAIAGVKTGSKGPFDDVPVEPVVIKSAKVVSDK